MARTGVTQEDVNTAADRLLLAGDRPTIERVRQVLGTGSPNTLIKLMDVWWTELGHRMQAQAVKLDLPQAPTTVTALASALWEQALEVARTEAEQALANAHEQLALDRAALADERQALHQTVEAQAAETTAAQHAASVAHTRLADASRLVDQQTVQLSDLGRQRDAAQQRADRLESEMAEMHERLREQQAAFTTERDRHVEYVAALENRASVEIDRARQETRALRNEVTAIQKEQALVLNLAHRQRDEAIAALAAAQNDAATQRARAEAIERQQIQLSDLAATVQNAINDARSQQPSATKKKEVTSRAPPAGKRASRRTSTKR